MTIHEAWENIKYRLNKAALLDHSYSPFDRESEEIIQKIINFIEYVNNK